MAKLFVEAGLITLVAFISPFRAEREMARGLVAPGEFIEIYVDTPLAICEGRDPKGLYKKARRRRIAEFHRSGFALRAAEQSRINVNALNENPSDLADRIIDYMQRRGMLS